MGLSDGKILHGNEHNWTKALFLENANSKEKEPSSVDYTCHSIIWYNNGTTNYNLLP